MLEKGKVCTVQDEIYYLDGCVLQLQMSKSRSMSHEYFEYPYNGSNFHTIKW